MNACMRIIARCVRSDAVGIAEGDGDELKREHHLRTGEVERPAHVYGRSETDRNNTHTHPHKAPHNHTQPYTHTLSAPHTRTHTHTTHTTHKRVRVQSMYMR